MKRPAQQLLPFVGLPRRSVRGYHDGLPTDDCKTMATYSTNEFRSGMKVMLDGDPCNILENEFVKPGKGQAFNRVKMRNLKNGRVWERTFKSGESIEAADVIDLDMEYLYTDGEFWHFMKTDDSYEQVAADQSAVADSENWLKEQEVYQITLWNDAPIATSAQKATQHSDRYRQGLVNGVTQLFRVVSKTDDGAKPCCFFSMDNTFAANNFSPYAAGARFTTVDVEDCKFTGRNECQRVKIVPVKLIIVGREIKLHRRIPGCLALRVGVCFILKGSESFIHNPPQVCHFHHYCISVAQETSWAPLYRRITLKQHTPV